MSRQYAALSGVAIVLVVVNHTVHFGLLVSPVEGSWLKVMILLQALGAFAVPAFLFVSGAFLSYAAREISFTFVRASLGRMLWPYVFWSTVLYALVLLTQDVQPQVLGYIKNLLVGYPYHFIPLLIFWYVAAPLVVRIGRRHGVLLLVAIGAYQALLIVLRSPEMSGLARALPAWLHVLQPSVLATPMSEWAIYFPMGLVVSQHAAALKPRLRRVRWLTAAATAGLFVLGVLNAFEMIWAPWARFAAPVPLMFLLPVIDRDTIPLVRGFETVGRRSYGIYLAHFAVINVAAVLASRLAAGLEAWPVIVFPLFFVVALGGALLLMDVSARVRPARPLYRYVFGIVPPAGSLGRRRAAPGVRVTSGG